jgi:hypothetical protein
MGRFFEKVRAMNMYGEISGIVAFSICDGVGKYGTVETE